MTAVFSLVFFMDLIESDSICYPLIVLISRSTSKKVVNTPIINFDEEFGLCTKLVDSDIISFQHSVNAAILSLPIKHCPTGWL